MTPKRIQRKRTKGWTMPPNTVYVGRPTRWGNIYIIGRDGNAEECVNKYEWALNFTSRLSEVAELRGKDLACWCSLDQPCHADVLLRLANPEQALIETIVRNQQAILAVIAAETLAHARSAGEAKAAK